MKGKALGFPIMVQVHSGDLVPSIAKTPFAALPQDGLTCDGGCPQVLKLSNGTAIDPENLETWHMRGNLKMCKTSPGTVSEGGLAPGRKCPQKCLGGNGPEWQALFGASLSGKGKGCPQEFQALASPGWPHS